MLVEWFRQTTPGATGPWILRAASPNCRRKPDAERRRKRLRGRCVPSIFARPFTGIRSAENPSVAGLELPVASVQPPVALLLPGLTDPVLLENRLDAWRPNCPCGNGAATTRIAQQPAPRKPLAPPTATVDGSEQHSSHVAVVRALAELRAMYWMFCDPRLSSLVDARWSPVVILALIMTSYYWTPGTDPAVLHRHRLRETLRPDFGLWPLQIDIV